MPESSTVSHLSFEVADLEKSLAFYIPVMKLLRFQVAIEEGWAYFTGPDGFILNTVEAEKGADRTKNVHLAFGEIE